VYASGALQQRLTPKASTPRSFVMRPSRFLVLAFISSAVLLALGSSSGAQTLTVIRSFSDTTAAVSRPGRLTQGRDGYLYGMSAGPT